MERLPKTLVVDASILFSFFKRDSSRRRLIEKLPNSGCELICPRFVFRELMSDKEKVMKYGKINELSFTFLFSLLLRKVKLVSEKEFKESLPEANRISPHGEQKKDDPYFALALAFECGIWSDEIAFKQQSAVKVLNTAELLEFLGL